MKKSKAKSIQEFNDLEARGWVINISSEVEYYLDKIIMDFMGINEDRKVFFMNVLLNSANVSFGAKIKIFTQILEKLNEKKNYESLIKDLREMNKIRNYFAHCFSSDMILLNKQKEKVVEIPTILRNTSNAQGKVESRLLGELVREFDVVYNDKFRGNLKQIFNLVKSID